MGKGNFKRMKLLCMAACFCLFGQTAAFAGMNHTQAEKEVFVSGTKINGVTVSAMTPEEAKGYIEAYYGGDYTLTLIRQDGTEEAIRGSEIGLAAVVGDGLSDILDEQNANGRVYGPAFNNNFNVPMDASYSDEALAARLQTLDCVSGSEVVTTANAYISGYVEGQGFSIVPEVQGNDIDVTALTAAVRAALAEGKNQLDLEAAGCYRKPTLTEEDPQLLAQLDSMNQRTEMTVTYQFGDDREVLDGASMASWIQGYTAESGLLVDQAKVSAYVKSLADKYDTAGTARSFKTASGAEVTVTGPYGWKIDQPAETLALTTAIQVGQSVEKEPAYSQTAASRGGNDYGTTYVEVDLGNQHMYLVENGVCVLDAPFVSGNVSKDWTTPPGIFGLYYKQRDKVLRGEDYATPVKYWMPFNGGIGLHDADWRSSFGGTIYQTNGSHGCINLPPSKAAVLYDHVYKNMPIICHN